MADRSYDLFISYCSANVDLARMVCERLEEAGFSVWLDKSRLEPGCDWHGRLETGRNASRIVLPLLTPEWNLSDWCLFEAYGGEHVIPILCQGEQEDVTPKPLRRYQHFDLRNPQTADWEKLFEAIRAYLTRPKPLAQSRIGWLPFPRNPNFVGRQKDLIAIHEQLCPAVEEDEQPQTPALTSGSAVVVAGGAGYGKTTIAREYIEQFWQSYDRILWVRAEDSKLLESEFGRLAQELGLVDTASTKAAEDAQRALVELNGPATRLLVFDNAENEATIRRWLPTTGGCRVLITSRYARWPAAVHVHEINVLAPQPARELLLKRSGSAEDDTAADLVAKQLGYLPLALEHAAAFVKEQGLRFEQYLQSLADPDARKEMFADLVQGGTEYPLPLAISWLTTIDRLGPLPRAILTLSAFFDPDNIPRDLLYAAASDLAKASGAREISDVELMGALGELRRYSLLTGLDDRAYSLHRLVQTIERDALDEGSYKEWAERAVKVVDAAYPDMDASRWEDCTRLLPHAQAAVEIIKECSFEFSRSGTSTFRDGCVLHQDW